MSNDVFDANRMPPRRFWLARHHDVLGGNRTGIVAEGVIWSSGKVALHWPGQPVTTSSWASLDDLLAGQAQGDSTMVEFVDGGHDWHCEHIECVEYDGGAIWIH